MIPSQHSFNVAESNEFRLRPRMEGPELQLPQPMWQSRGVG